MTSLGQALYAEGGWVKAGPQLAPTSRLSWADRSCPFPPLGGAQWFERWPAKPRVGS